MKKRVLSVLLALAMVFCSGLAFSASAEDAPKLKFNDGKFKIMHLTDTQDVYPASKTMLSFIDASIKQYQPDIVILGGDNTVGPAETKDEAIKELTSVFVENEVYFSLVFGNHDREQGVSNDELLALYQKHGGEYCLAYDAVPELHGAGTHNLPVYSSDGSKIIFNLWMFDSGSGVYNEAGERLGYDCVTEDQIKWYESVSSELEKESKVKIPSLAFQHIIVGDVYDALFHETAVEAGELTRCFNGKIYSCLPKTENFDGFLFEYPCPGYYNFGQFDSMVARGDVIGIFSGHDHVNTFETELKGIKIVNTPGATYHSYGNDLVRGMRMITVCENDTWNFDTEVVTVNDLAAQNADFAKEAGISSFKIWLCDIAGNILLGFGKLSSVFSKVISIVG